MKPDIAFLHTTPVHQPNFEKLMREAAPHLRTAHLVREDLLADARLTGADEPGLVERIRNAMHDAADGAKVVVCTCSTIGGVAEAIDTGGAFSAMRIDRAMADAAVQDGRPVLMVAAVDSTLAPTRALLESSAQRLGRRPPIEQLLVEDAWRHFEAGDINRYIAAIVEAIANADATSKIVVLAQASMAPAAEELEKRGITTLTSPRAGVARALSLLADLARSPKPTG